MQYRLKFKSEYAIQMCSSELSNKLQPAMKKIIFQISIHVQCIPLQESDRLRQWLKNSIEKTSLQRCNEIQSDIGIR